MSDNRGISAFKKQFNNTPGDAPINSFDAKDCRSYNDGFQRFGQRSTIHAQPPKMVKAPELLNSKRKSMGFRNRDKDISSGKPMEAFNPFKKNEKERGWVDKLKDRMTQTFAKNKDNNKQEIAKNKDNNKQEIPKKRLSSSNDFEDTKFACITKAPVKSELAELFSAVECPTSQKNEEIVKYANEDFRQAFCPKP